MIILKKSKFKSSIRRLISFILNNKILVKIVEFVKKLSNKIVNVVIEEAFFTVSVNIFMSIIGITIGLLIQVHDGCEISFPIKSFIISYGTGYFSSYCLELYSVLNYVNDKCLKKIPVKKLPVFFGLFVIFVWTVFIVEINLSRVLYYHYISTGILVFLTFISLIFFNAEKKDRNSILRKFDDLFC